MCVCAYINTYMYNHLVIDVRIGTFVRVFRYVVLYKVSIHIGAADAITGECVFC